MRALGTQALNQFSVNRDDAIEELGWSLFDFTTYLAAGQTSLAFFQSPVGQAGKTNVDTNMDLAGQIPKGQNFLVESICVEFFPNVTVDQASELNNYADDIKAVAENGLLTFSVGSKDYKREAPLGIFPQQYRQSGFAAMASTTTITATTFANGIQYSQNVGKEHKIIPVRLTSNQNFNVTLTWPVVVPLPSSSAGRIGVRLVGRLFRNAQ